MKGRRKKRKTRRCLAEPRRDTSTANPTEVVLAETETGRGILGVVDGFSPKGVEDEAEIKWRKEFLRKIGYKL
jgi:adenosine/AMP kinase